MSAAASRSPPRSCSTRRTSSSTRVDGFVEKFSAIATSSGISSIMVGGLGELDAGRGAARGHLIGAVIESPEPTQRSPGTGERPHPRVHRQGRRRQDERRRRHGAGLRRSRLPHDHHLDRHRPFARRRLRPRARPGAARDQPEPVGAGVGRLLQRHALLGTDPGVRGIGPALAWPRRRHGRGDDGPAGHGRGRIAALDRRPPRLRPLRRGGRRRGADRRDAAPAVAARGRRAGGCRRSSRSAAGSRS